RGELAVGGALRGSFRHLRCGLLPSGRAVSRVPVSSPNGLMVGANVAESKRAIAHSVRHSSDRVRIGSKADGRTVAWARCVPYELSREALAVGDRKSTRLNSSHVKISYAVFC